MLNREYTFKKMPRVSRLFVRVLRVPRLKILLWLLFCGLLLSKTKQILLDDSSVGDSPGYTFIVQHHPDIGVSSPPPPTECNKNKHLGVPRFVDEMCRPEDRLVCRNLTCERLLTGNDNSVYRTAREFMKNYTRRKMESHEFIRMAENCSSFLLERGFAQKMSESVEDFPVAFNILAHGNVEQVERLIHALYRRSNRFCVHFDLKSMNGSQEALEAIGRCLPNVFSASRRIHIFWGGFGRLEADLVCMKDHVNSSSDWKYLINTAGQAFPLRSVREMVEILRIYNGANDVEGMYGERVLRHRFEYKFEINKEGIIALKEPNVKHPAPPHELEIVRGSAYGVFSRRFVEFLLTDQKSKDFLEWSRETFSPDELYFSTLHHTYANPHIHSPGSYSGHPNEKPWLAVYANWGSEPCSGYERHGICVFGVEDLPRLLRHREIFANKFLVDFEPMALECLRAWVNYKDSCTGTELLDRDFYKSLPFIRKDS